MVRKKFVKHFPDLMKRLQREEGKINQEFLKSDLGQHLLRDVLRKIIKETDEEKIDSLKTFLVNSCTTVDEYWIDKCYKILLKMKPVHIHILSTLSSPERIVDTIIAQQDKTKGAEFYPPNGFNEYYFKIEPSIFEDVIDELIVWNVLGKIHNSNSQTHLKFNEDWLRSVIINSPHITDFGKKLLEYLKK